MKCVVNSYSSFLWYKDSAQGQCDLPAQTMAAVSLTAAANWKDLHGNFEK